MPDWTISILETPEHMAEVEKLQRIVWPGSETDVIPAHMLLASAHNGGILIGAFADRELIGAVFGFPALEFVADGPVLKHHSHILAVHPNWRTKGVGFALKRAQWQMVRKQGIDRVTWTYDPLLSRNAYLNIARLGAVCNTYIRNYYGEMRDGLNVGLASDRFQVDWWVNTRRVQSRLSKQPRNGLDFADFEKADIQPVYSVSYSPQNLIQPPLAMPALQGRLMLAEIPVDFLHLKAQDLALGQAWRQFSRAFFELAFAQGYIVTDFIYDTSDEIPHSFYVLAHGESTLDDLTVSKT